MLNESRQVTAGSNASVTQLQVQEQVHIQELSNGNIGTRTSENPIVEDYHQRENEVMQQHATNAMADLLENETSENIPQRTAETEILDIEQLFQADSFENELIAAGQSQFQLSEWTTHPSTPPQLPFSYVNADTPTVQLHQSLLGEKEQELERAFSELDVLLEEEVTVEVKRHTVLEDVQRIYSNQSIINKRLHVNFIGEEGDDFGGLTKDLFSSFWNSAFIQWFKGEDALVPCIPVNQYAKAQDIFSVVGKVFSHMCQLNHCVPPRFCRSTLLTIVFNTSVIDSRTLLDDFMLHVTVPERTLLQKALNSFEKLSISEKSDLLTFYSVNGMHTVPSAKDFREQLVLVAQNELVIKPMFLNCFIRQAIPESHMRAFWSQLDTDLISYLYWQEMPTADRVLQCITTSENDLKPEEEVAYYYLRDFIKSVDQDEMSKFLHFVTGSPLLPNDGITIVFNRLCGSLRRPIAHTCSNTLEIPVSYASVQDFKREMKSILNSENAFIMTMI
ncbi:hypothetical protein AOXY_G5102 [Acipenser oxyrinchus oxyrinchus]|uniref:HECT-type E3 ubiquitin transferase n=1 Tax=Acipenser oxyrinchus oxyrinchus TaxID=40147 RepID=A0AAD8GDX7_ACIOX|nr:hypothetical protein AOXY_G5102 [Acipenser oxyrinchus oxyrinchus]